MLGATAVPAAATTTISARVAKTNITLGSSVGVSGTISDRSATRTYLQRKGGRGWVDIAGMSVRNGAFSTTITPTGVGIYSFRVRSRSGATVSSTFYLKVVATVADGTYRLYITDSRDHSCPYGPLDGRTLTVRGATASLKVGATLSGPVTRSGSNFTMSLDSTDPTWVANLTMTGTAKPNALLVGRLEFGGVYPSGQTGWVCDMPFEALGPQVSGPSCARSVIERVALPAGYRWEDAAPVCTGTWAAARTRYRSDEVPSSEVLRWNGKAWILYPGQCTPRFEAVIPAVVYRYACWQD
ncbi:MAG: hypothetical protein KF703_07420 [Actinobacteria bacterium]|nr:hypothetical protein [Actinomycetota bacterium]